MMTLARHAFLKSPEKVSGLKSFVMYSMLIKKYSIFIDTESKAIKSKVDEKCCTGLWAENFIAT